MHRHDINNVVASPRHRGQYEPRWFSVETNEPVYNNDGDDDDTPKISEFNVKDITKAGCKDRREAIVDYAARAKSASARQRLPPSSCAKKPPLPPGVMNKSALHASGNSAVNKAEDRGYVDDRRLESWLRFASSREDISGERMFGDDGWSEGKLQQRSCSNVGLVGPYRVEQSATADQEELIEEIVDSVSEIESRDDGRPKWRIVKTQHNLHTSDTREFNERYDEMEDDNSTLVPAGEFSGKDENANDTTQVAKLDDDTKQQKSTAAATDSWKLRETIFAGVKYGKEERAVDVPDGASAVSADAMTKAAGKTNNNNNNDQHDKDSLNETGSTTGVDASPSGGGNHPSSGNNRNHNDNNNDSFTLRDSNGLGGRSHSPPPKSLVSRILARSRSSDELLDHSEPFSQLWVVLSNVYGELVIVLTMALCLAEVMDTPVPLLSLQGIFLMYMYVGSIAVILGIYIWVLIDSCGNMRNGRHGLNDAEIGAASLTRFGSLKRAHISRSRTTPTSFYIRVGALLFGLATLVFNGLEMAMHSMMQGAECLSDIIFVHPVLHGLFTFLQMHFLFVNSQVLVERFGLAARFGFVHLAATNIAVWVRLVIWDSAQEWTYFVHVAQRGPLNAASASPLNLRGFPGSLTKATREVTDEVSYQHQHAYEPISQDQISQVVALQECLNTNALGQLWTSSMPFLYPFIVQFSLIAAAVTFVMGQNVGRSSRVLHKKFHSMKDLPSTGRIGCDGSSKGLFLGILCMVAGIVVILIFLVVRDDTNFPPSTLSWLTCGTLIAILTLSGIMTASGLVQIRQMSVVTRAPAMLDSLLSNVALFGVQLYSVFTIVVCACSLFTLAETGEEGDKDVEDMRGRHIVLLTTSALQLVQCFAQSTLIGEASKRCCITRFQMMAKPGRQIVTFLLFSNAVLWAFDTVVTQNWISQELQLRFFGVLAWGVISRIGLPLLIFYRFHSCVLLLEAWNKCYRTLKNDLPLN